MPRRLAAYLLSSLALIGCGSSSTDTGVADSDDVNDGNTTVGGLCDYPAGANEVMTQGDVLLPYAWNKAIHRSDGRDGTIDLAQVPCAADDDIDWSPFDVLLFVSIPAW